MKIFSILTLMLILTSCRTTNSLVFLGETIRVDYPKRIDILTNGRTIELEGIYTGAMFAYDDLLVLKSHKHPDGIMYLFDVETGRRVNTIGKIGSGPNEFTHIAFYGFERDSSNKINMWINDANRREPMLLNMQGEVVKKINTSELKVLIITES